MANVFRLLTAFVYKCATNLFLINSMYREKEITLYFNLKYAARSLPIPYLSRITLKLAVLF